MTSESSKEILFMQTKIKICARPRTKNGAYMKGQDKTQGDAGAWGDTCEICNPKIQSINCIAYALKKMVRKGQY
jgi:hypothetical protein